MKSSGIQILILIIALILAAGCTQSSPAPVPQPVTTAVTPSLPAAETTVPSVTASAPQVTVTVIHYIVPVKSWKDSELHLAFEASGDWNVTTRVASQPDSYQGHVYNTVLVPGGGFSIITYPVSLNQDQAYRDEFRGWTPAPVETTVTINNIVYGRFESTANGQTRVGYVVQKASASDIGFASVLTFTTDNVARPFDKADFEKVVSSFTYFTENQAANVTGEEIPRVR